MKNIPDRLSKHLIARLSNFTDKLKDRYLQWKDPERYWQNKQKIQQAEEQIQMVRQRRRMRGWLPPTWILIKLLGLIA